MSSLIWISWSSAFRPFDARKYRENSNWQLDYLNHIRKNIVNYGQPHIVLLWHSSSFCSPITASKLCTRECKLPATFIFRQNARAEYTNVQRSVAFSFFYAMAFSNQSLSCFVRLLAFLTNCTKQSHFTKLLCRFFLGFKKCQV